MKQPTRNDVLDVVRLGEKAQELLNLRVDLEAILAGAYTSVSIKFSGIPASMEVLITDHKNAVMNKAIAQLRTDIRRLEEEIS